MIVKALLLVTIVLLLVWLLRGSRRSQRPPAPPPAPTPPQPMLRCAHCGLHLPEADAVRGRTGLPYCGDAHRRAAEAPDDRG